MAVHHHLHLLAASGLFVCIIGKQQSSKSLTQEILNASERHGRAGGFVHIVHTYKRSMHAYCR